MMGWNSMASSDGRRGSMLAVRRLGGHEKGVCARRRSSSQGHCAKIHLRDPQGKIHMLWLSLKMQQVPRKHHIPPEARTQRHVPAVRAAEH